VRVLYISEVQWLSQPSRKHQLIHRFPDDWRILFLSPINAKPGENSLRTRTDPVHKNVSFRSLPLPKPDSTNAVARALSDAFAPMGYRALRTAMSAFGPDILVTSYIWSLPVLPHARALGLPVVYDCNDLHPDFYRTRAEAARRAFKGVVESADQVVASSPRLREVCGRGVVVGNGVDLETFAGRENWPLPGALAESPIGARPRLVAYVGSVNRRLDFRILEAVAEAGKRENFGLFCLGRIYDAVRADVDALKERFPEQVIFTGLVDYPALPSYLSHALVGIAPFVLDERTKAINPNKLYMYAAMEENIVSTPFSTDVTEHEDLVYIESDPDAFARAVVTALEDDERRLVVRERIALPNDWSAKAREFIETLESVAARAE
jgi:teichuronic acid biosynthesis glycosyltransferase TuaH